MTDAVSYLDAVVLGIVEGLTEFLPVSSTGHLTVAEKLLGLRIDDPAITAYTVIIQFGAIVATFLYFRSDIARLAAAWGRGVVADARHRLAARRAPGTHRPVAVEERDYRFAWYVLAGSIPVVVAGVLFRGIISGPLRNLWVVAIALVAWSAVMYLAEVRGRQTVSEKDLTLRHVLIIGLVQCVSLVPGVSRSGATIAAGLLQDVDRVTATRLSFFLAIPALTGAGLYQLQDIDTAVVSWGTLAVGTVISFVVAYASIAWLLRFVARHPITIFVGYRVVAGLALMAALGAGVLTAT